MLSRVFFIAAEFPERPGIHPLQPPAFRAEQVIAPVAVQYGNAPAPPDELLPHVFREKVVAFVIFRPLGKQRIIGRNKLIPVPAGHLAQAADHPAVRF